MPRARLFALFIVIGLFCLIAPESSALEAKLRVDAGLTGINRWVAFADGGWVQVEKGRLEFYAPNGERHRTLKLRGNEVLVAPHGCRAAGVISYADFQPNTLHAVTFDLYGPTGEQILRLSDPHFASAIVSEAGNAFVGVDGAEGLPLSVLRFYDLSGKERKSLEVERFEGGAFCADGSVFLFETAADGLQACDAAGEVLGKIGRADRWAASADAGVVARVADNRLFFYREGELFQTLPWDTRYGTVRAVALSPNGSHAAVVSGSRAAVIEVDSARILWDAESSATPWNYRSASLTDDATLVAFGSDYDPGVEAEDRHLRSRCEVFDRAGRLIHAEEGQPAKWGALFPQVRFDRSQPLLMFIDRDHIKLFSIE